MTCVAYTLFSIKWLLNIEICLARVLLVYACYYWFLIRYLITDSTYKLGPSLIFLLNWLIHNSTDLAFTNFSLGWESNSFFFLASIVEYFLLMSSRNLIMMCFLSISVILHEQQINCISYSIVWHSCLFWIILLISSTRLSTKSKYSQKTSAQNHRPLYQKNTLFKFDTLGNLLYLQNN